MRRPQLQYFCQPNPKRANGKKPISKLPLRNDRTSHVRDPSAHVIDAVRDLPENCSALANHPSHTSVPFQSMSKERDGEAYRSCRRGRIDRAPAAARRALDSRTSPRQRLTYERTKREPIAVCACALIDRASASVAVARMAGGARWGPGAAAPLGHCAPTR